MRKALLLALICGVALAACRPDPTPTPSPPTATYPPQATPTPLGGPLVIFWSIVDSAADGSEATYTVRINASGGTAPYTYYHGATRLDGATFTVSQPCPPDAPVTFDIRVESADGQADAMQGALPATCPTPAPLVEVTPTVVGAPAIANPDRPPAGRPAFYALTFGASADAPATLLFPAGTARVVARWRHQLIAEDETVHRRITYTPGRPEPTTARPWQEASDTWDRDADGEATYTIESGPAGAPLEPGVYTLRLSLQSDPYRFVEGAFVVLPEAVEVGGVARFGVPASTDAPQACLLWQIGPTSADLDYRLLDDPTELLTSWGAQGFAPSPDGARVAYVSAFLGFGGQPVRQPHVYTWDGGADRALDLDGAAGAPAWSADGTLLAVTDATGVTVFDLDGDGAPLFLPGAAHPRFAPAGNRLAFVRDGAALVIRDPDGAERVVAETAWEAMGEIAWTPDGARLYYVEQGPPVRQGPGGYVNGVLWTVSAGGGDAARWSVNTYVSPRDLLIAPGGRYLLAKDGTGAVADCQVDERLHVFDLETEDPMRQDRTLWDISGGGESAYSWLTEGAFLLVRQPRCSGLAAEFIRVEAANGRAAWLGGLPNTPTGPACR